jgi:hypothetical protein
LLFDELCATLGGITEGAAVPRCAMQRRPEEPDSASVALSRDLWPGCTAVPSLPRSDVPDVWKSLYRLSAYAMCSSQSRPRPATLAAIRVTE